MLNLLSILFYIAAGFLFYTASLLSFVCDSGAGVDKWWIVLGFTAPALVALAIGLALKRFRDWRRHAGIVLLSASGFTAFLVFSFVCMYISDESRALMKPEVWKFFSDYVSGGGVTIGMAVLGFVMLRANGPAVAQHRSPDAEAPQP